ncbi:glycosyltransferase family 4 protein [Paenibacillus sp. SEL3]|jgi:UDP-GlcNAc:undecaprenyl-phosphate GlcNAc-1-phosphate transferase|uniref:Undecaprenyl/decaprenyl-phosphate alpha-N-acetylglucosaminyl 1-phosphate transferase n=1 Tax=Paenibacillus polymyxa TaxID=1406 RepID=A0A8I1J0D7_PAEPO|nr:MULTISPECIES: MraY family glycosyltransferase [Paenibacillus]KAF6575996.1 undecaprenyl/decaprenyl-phosphate alpha-N-acetylglucosaminyl 1-phosphate transferase [Paenibacillus sp. EKM206P]KAF6589629.1 undecaprenyl/decaprenyl-phosphate alpha-N-acetylglucosaminyl 1-phosphate transferase [Paenibacillus sp. EKM205P]MBM0633349.1 undecaprenyl/decaprenyl-phosphate alpha-N-acetylglucosaminyl 1-phosphate transferase [Paenibacillus polymyxa]MBO3285271.1 undecaprenyl/decaprenyl-phosphate alpha-N-acetylgl
MLLIYIIGFIMALGLALLLTPLVKKFAVKVGAVDVPNARKVHTRIMPRLGGLGIFLAFLLSLLAVLPFVPDGMLSSRDINFIAAFLIGGTLITLIGALDDRFDLNAKLKFLAQIAVACMVVFAFDIRVDFVNVPFQDAYSSLESWISIPLTIFWIVGVTNAINLIDGLDGLAAGVSGIAIGTIFVMSILMGNYMVAMLCLVLLGSIIGFLFFNFHPAKIFMGDTGSLFLGFCLAMLSMLGFKQIAIVSFITPLIIIGVPLSDTFFAIIRRKLQKKPIFSPDKGHLHHCLRELGFSHRQTVLIIYGIAAFFGVLAVIQSSAALNEANWVTFVVICIMMFFLQIGAEVIGLVGKTKRPVINTLIRLLAKPDSQTRSKL